MFARRRLPSRSYIAKNDMDEDLREAAARKVEDKSVLGWSDITCLWTLLFVPAPDAFLGGNRASCSQSSSSTSTRGGCHDPTRQDQTV